ncbi:MAG TPA: hypothetical protein VFE52_06545 [Devosia sp.]|nr:hypothetical protein [Devosia sp.]
MNHAERAREVFVHAMLRRQRVRCTYQGVEREICPVMVGRTDREDRALVYQVGGATKSGPLARSEWKCLRLGEVRDAAITKGRWFVGNTHTTASSCMAVVDLDVNPNSPYTPKLVPAE